MERKRAITEKVDVAVTMTMTLVKRLDDHLKILGEDNRSAWIRAAIISKMTREIESLSEPKEPTY